MVIYIGCWANSFQLPFGYDYHSELQNEPFIDDVPIKSDDFPWLC